MAYRSYGKSRKSSKSKKKYTEVERLAYNMGRIKKGLSNPNSRVYESYVNGCNDNKTSKKKKPLF